MKEYIFNWAMFMIPYLLGIIGATNGKPFNPYFIIIISMIIIVMYNEIYAKK